jgi:SAM-dependent methyltransferase
MTTKNFDKYDYYFRSVQNPEGDTDFFIQAYEELKNKKPLSLREDFCGTFAICCEWVKKNVDATAVGVDLSQEPLDYGLENYFSKLTASQRDRVKVLNKSVLDEKLPSTDIIAALNFSYFIFKKREELKEYFANSFRTLKSDGVFIIDCFGGGQCQGAIEEETEHTDFSYFWDQMNFNPIKNEAEFYIHFKLKDQPKIEKVFHYDWRLWTIPELKEILAEVGFKNSVVYWEGTNSKGDGNGSFTKTEVGEECDSWIAYIVSEKK